MPTSKTIKIKNARLSFARLFEPKAFTEGQKPRYEATFLLDPSDKAHQAIIDEIIATANDLVEQEWDGSAPKALACCFQYADGETVIELGSEQKAKWRGQPKEYDGYDGMFFLSSNNQTRPTVVDQKLVPLVAEDAKPYSGCYVNGSITLWTQDNQYGKRINANLRAVQFVKDGEAFGVKQAAAEEEFDVIEVDDADDFLD